MTSQIKAHLALAVVGIVYGYFYVVVKQLLETVSEPTLIGLRIVLTAVLAIGIEWGFLRTKFARAADLAGISLLSILGILVVQSLLVVGVHQTSTFHTGLIMASIPLWTLLFGMLVKSESVNWRKIVGIGIAFGGVSFLLSARHPSPHQVWGSWWGDGLILANAILFSTFLIGSRYFVARYRAFSVMAYGYLASALLYLIFLLLSPWPGFNWGAVWHDVQQLSGVGWLMVSYVVVLASLGTYTINNYALIRTSPATVAAYIFLQPICGGFFGWILLGEPLTWAMAVSGLVVFIGLWVAFFSGPSGRPVPTAL